MILLTAGRLVVTNSMSEPLLEPVVMIEVPLSVWRCVGPGRVRKIVLMGLGWCDVSSKPRKSGSEDDTSTGFDRYLQQSQYAVLTSREKPAANLGNSPSAGCKVITSISELRSEAIVTIDIRLPECRCCDREG